METNALTGMNVAQLVVDDYNQVLELDPMQKAMSEKAKDQKVEEL
jgi:hypothetical protein